MSAWSTSTPPPVAEAIESAIRAASGDTRTNAEIVEVDQEVSKLGAAIENLLEQRAALEEYRARLVERSREETVERRDVGHDALYSALEAQAEALHTRGEAWATVQPDRLALTPPLDPVMVTLFDELQALHDDPEAQDRVRDRFVQLLREQTAPRPFDGPELAVDVVCSVDAPHGAPELLVVLIPVAAGADDPATARDQLPTWLAARVGEAVFAASRAVGFPEVDVRSGPALGRDLLDLEVDLHAAPDGLVPAIVAALGEHLQRAPELRAGGVKVRVTEVDAAIVFPDAEADDG